MKLTTKIRAHRREQYTEVKILISHPMENGRNRDPITGALIPAHFIQELTVKLNDRPVIRTNLGGGVSTNPYFSFRLKHANVGDMLTVHWIDNLGLTGSDEHIIQ